MSTNEIKLSYSDRSLLKVIGESDRIHLTHKTELAVINVIKPNDVGSIYWRLGHSRNQQVGEADYRENVAWISLMTVYYKKITAPSKCARKSTNLSARV